MRILLPLLLAATVHAKQPKPLRAGLRTVAVAA